MEYETLVPCWGFEGRPMHSMSAVLPGGYWLMLTNGHCKILPLILKARVFELVRSDGTPSGKVIKVAHADLGHKILNSPVVWIGGEREWEIGIQVC